MKPGQALIVAVAGAGLLLFTASANAQMRGGGFRGGGGGGFHGAPAGGGFRGAPAGGFRGAPAGGFRGAPARGFHGNTAAALGKARPGASIAPALPTPVQARAGEAIHP